MGSRLIVAILGTPVLVYIYIKGGLLALLLVNIVVAISLYEFYSMGKKAQKNSHNVLGIGASLAIVNMTYLRNINEKYVVSDLEIIIFMLLIILTYRVYKKKIENISSEIGLTLLGVIYIGFSLSKIIDIGFLPNGGKIILTIQVLVWLCDTAAYHVGKGLGGKIFKDGLSSISPNKTKEGTLGGACCTIVVLYYVNNYCNVFPRLLSIFEVIVIGLLLGLLISLGDLVESMFKREFNIKDSGKILGGHGGMLDKFDSFIFILPITYYAVKYLMI